VPCNREGKVAEPMLSITFAPDARGARAPRWGWDAPEWHAMCSRAERVLLTSGHHERGIHQHATAECRLQRLKPCRGERYSVVCVSTLYSMVTLAIRIAYV
jgi:hypothetical protein